PSPPPRSPRSCRAANRAPAPTSPSRPHAARRCRRPLARAAPSARRRFVRAVPRPADPNPSPRACAKHHPMAAIAVERPRTRYAETVKRGTGRVALFIVVFAALWALWEGYRWLWMREGWSWPFTVDRTTMPHLDEVVRALFRHSSSGTGGRLITQLLHAAVFTAKE